MEEEITQEDLEEMQDIQEEQQEDTQEEQLLKNLQLQEAYGSPTLEEKQNQHSFLHKAAFGSPDTVRTTFLSESELGRPLFNVRFLLDLHDICKYYVDPICRKLKLDPYEYNRLARYFWEKIQNVTSSGMSYKGFAMNLNVTKKMDTLRKKIRDTTGNLKGGEKK